MPLLEKYFILKVGKELKSVTVGSKEFLEMRKVIEEKNNEIHQKKL